MKLENSNFEKSIRIRFWPFEIRLPNTDWSKFHEISSMPELNSGHQPTHYKIISHGAKHTYFTLWGNLRVGTLLTSSGPGIYSNYTSVILDGYYESTTVNA